MTNINTLIFTEHPSVTLATCTFVNVPVILQYEETPLIQIVKAEQAGFTTEIPIYHSDGTYLAKVVGSRLFLTPDGEKAGITLAMPDKMTVCRLGDRVLFEIRREQAAALKTQAELFAPDGYFVKCSESPRPHLYDASGTELRLSGLVISGSTIVGRIGIWIKRGSVAVGCA